MKYFHRGVACVLNFHFLEFLIHEYCGDLCSQWLRFIALLTLCIFILIFPSFFNIEHTCRGLMFNGKENLTYEKLKCRFKYMLK